MPLDKCARCNKLFDRTAGNICPQCLPEEEADYEKVRKLLEENPNLSAENLVELTDIELSVIMRLLENGRIATAPSENVKCGRCGAPAISMSKKLCERCLNELNTQIARQQANITLPKKKEVRLGSGMNVRKWEKDDKEQRQNP